TKSGHSDIFPPHIRRTRNLIFRSLPEPKKAAVLFRPRLQLRPPAFRGTGLLAGGGFGLIGDIAIGIVGALIGSWLMPRLGIHMGGGVISSIIVATIGAVLLLVIVGLLSGAYPRRRFWFHGGFPRRRFW